MAVNWNILQPVDIGGAISGGFQFGRQLVEKEKAKGALAAYIADPTNVEAQNALAYYSPQFGMQLAHQRSSSAAAAEERQRLGSYFQNPDRSAAKQQALQSGDLDTYKIIDQLDDDQKKAAATMYKVAAPVAYQALKFKTPEERRAYIQSVKPELVANGWEPEAVDAFDPSDENLTGVVHMGMTLEQAMGRDKISYENVGPGDRLVPFDATGRPVAGTGQPGPIDNPSSPPSLSSPPTTGGGGETVDLQGAASLGQKFGKVTSTTRTPEHNRKVGGVANSYHLKGRAIDIARAPGVSHTQIEQAYRQAGYNLVESLDEGDHSHFAFASGPSNNQDRIRTQAREAIAAGADPVAVKARAAKMGVSL